MRKWRENDVLAAALRYISRSQPLSTGVPGICSVPDCGRPIRLNGLCQAHDKRRRKGKVGWDAPIEDYSQRISKTGICSVPDCGRSIYNKGLCQAHRSKQRAGITDWDAPIRPKAERAGCCAIAVMPQPGPIPCAVRKSARSGPSRAARRRTERQRRVAVAPASAPIRPLRRPRGALRQVIEVEKLETGERVAKLIHSKDDADGARWGFNLGVVELTNDEGEALTDEDGDPVTTLIVRETSETPEPKARDSKPKVAPSEQIALNMFDRAMREGDGTLATVGPDNQERPVLAEFLWRRRYYSEAPQDTKRKKDGSEPTQADIQDGKRQASVRAMKGLLAKDLIAVRDGFVWRPDAW